MDELILKQAGNIVGPASTSKFQVYLELYKSDTSDTGVLIKTRYYIYCVAGKSNFGTPVTSWGKSAAIGTTGKTYCDTGISSGEWIPYGTTKTYSIEAHYTGGSGTRYQSTASASYYEENPIPPEPEKYTITYDANGGTGAPDPQENVVGNATTISNITPKKTGHTFVNWSDGTTTYSPGQSYEGGSVTLYAQWEPNTYTVSYDANGGTGAPGVQTKTYGQALTLSTTVPQKINYEFVGWAKSTTGNVSYQPGQQYTADESIKLYAVWKMKANGYAKTAEGWKPAMIYAKTAQGWKQATLKAKTSEGWKDSTI